jgi:membrane-bound ClpP family serine protease
LQESRESTDVHSDFAELTFTLEQDVDEHNGYKYAYSGIEWLVKSHHPLAKGTPVKVVKKEVGVFWVEQI